VLRTGRQGDGSRRVLNVLYKIKCTDRVKGRPIGHFRGQEPKSLPQEATCRRSEGRSDSRRREGMEAVAFVELVVELSGDSVARFPGEISEAGTCSHWYRSPKHGEEWRRIECLMKIAPRSFLLATLTCLLCEARWRRFPSAHLIDPPLICLEGPRSDAYVWLDKMTTKRRPGKFFIGKSAPR